MIELFGHADNVYLYGKMRPKVAVFTGPKSVGKWTTARYIAEQLYENDDVLLIGSLTMDNARKIQDFSMSGSGRLVIVQVEARPDLPLNVLLKAMEESKSTSFIIVSSLPVLPATVLSRAKVFWFRPLSKDLIQKILTSRFKKKSGEAERLAGLAQGTVAGATENEILLEAKPAVLAAVNAVRTRDSKLLFKQASSWNDATSQALTQWCTEVITKKWRIYEEEETLESDKDLAILILQRVGKVRARLVVHSILNDLIINAR